MRGNWVSATPVPAEHRDSSLPLGPYEVSNSASHIQEVAMGLRLKSVSRKGHQAQDFLFNLPGKKDSLVN